MLKKADIRNEKADIDEQKADIKVRKKRSPHEHYS